MSGRVHGSREAGAMLAGPGEQTWGMGGILGSVGHVLGKVVKKGTVYGMAYDKKRKTQQKAKEAAKKQAKALRIATRAEKKQVERIEAKTQQLLLPAPASVDEATKIPEWAYVAVPVAILGAVWLSRRKRR